jgi:regulation of enolase protein 1 (concanavalin A-like superfamily)
MMRHLILLPLLAPLAAAAPVPAESDQAKLERLFGAFATPDKKSTVKVDGEAVVFSLVGLADGLPNKWLDTPPRLTREVTGDFVVTCRSVVRLPKGATASDDRQAWVCGGLVVITGSGEAHRAGVQDLDDTGKRRAGTVFAGGGKSLALRRKEGDGDESWTRLARIGDTLTHSVSPDGLLWFQLGVEKGFTREPVQVGVFALHNLTQESTVKVDQFKLTRPKEGKK